MRRSSKLIIKRIFAIVCVGSIVGFHQTASAEWVDVIKQDRPITITTTGTVESSDYAKIGTPPSFSWGLSISYLAAEGSYVREGSVVVRFESSMQDNSFRQFSGELAVAKGELASTQAQNLQDLETENLNLANAESEAEKASRKAELPEGVVPGVEYAKLVEQKRLTTELLKRAKVREGLSAKVRETKLETLEKRIQRLESQVAAYQTELDSFTVRAPRDGLVMVGTDWNGEKLGLNSRASPGRAVLTIVDETKLVIRSDVPEHLAASLAENQRVKIVSEASGGAELTGRVYGVGSTVRRKSRNSQVMVRNFMVEPEGNYRDVLTLGNSVQLTVHVDTLRDVIAIPKDALIYRSGQPGVVTDSDWQPVELGQTSEESFIVLNGLDEGQRVQL